MHNPRHLTESQRLEYLRAMGVTRWLPRIALPGARPSPCWQWSGNALESAGNAVPRAGAEEKFSAKTYVGTEPAFGSTEGSGPAKTSEHPFDAAEKVDRDGSHSEMTSKPEDASQVLESLEQPRQGGPATAREPRPLEEPVSGQQELRTHLVMLRVGDLIVLNQLPLTSRDVVAPAERALLAAIMRVLGEELERDHPLLFFRWPPLNRSYYDVSIQVAQQSLVLLLKELAQGLTQCRLLILGESLAPLLNEHLIREAVASSSFNWVQADHCLFEAMAAPECKKTLWHQIQPLLNQTA